MNTSPVPTNGNRRARRWFRRGHRWAGLSLVAFILFLSITGIALNHSGGFELDRRYVTWPWLLDAYGLQVPEPAASFADRGHRATLLGEHLFLDGRDIGQRDDALTGVAVVGPIVVIGGERTLYVLTTGGDFVEAIDLGSMLDGPIERVGRAGDRAVVQSSGVALRSDPDIAMFEEWEVESATQWSTSTAPDKAELAELATAWRGRGVTIERLLLDLHSGRILGQTGRLLMDVIAVFLIVLSLSGIILSNARNRRR